MKTKMRIGPKIALIASAVIVLVVLAYCVLRFGFSIDILDRSGWHTEEGAVQYWDYYGRPQTGWQMIDGKQYYFEEETGNMVTGWQQIGNARHYFTEDGTPAAGWFQQDGKIYYLIENGKAVTGLYRLSQKLYCFSEDGAALTGWQTLDNERYCFSDTGAALSGWQTLDGQRYYFSEDGKPQKGWLTLEEKKYYFSEDGYTLSGWAEIAGERFLFAEDGSLYTGWFTDEEGTRFFDEDGAPYIGWLEWEEEQYYFGDDGLMHTGWLELDQDRYYLHVDGKMAVGEVEIDGVSNFFTSKGKWVLLVNPWHALPEDYTLDLVDLEGFEVDRQCRDALKAMMEDCRKAGYGCYINNTYRSVSLQQYMWNVRIEQRMAEGMSYDQAIAFIGQSLAKANHSEHHTGLAVDILGTQGMYDWLGEHCWDYGFILRYPDDKISITGIIFEPWHFRYVGTELSLELEELGLCMEEYIDMLTK